MPFNLLPHLRLLNPYLQLSRFSTMKPTNPSVKNYSSRTIPIFSRMFPHKLKYQSLSTKVGLPRDCIGVHRFSTRGRRGSGAEVRASKSLVDDEAELSDWISGLRSNSLLTRDDDNDSGSGRGRGRDSGSSRGDRDRDRDGGRDERSGRDGVRVSSFKRQRDGNSDDYSKPNRQMDRDSFSRGKTRFDDKLEGSEKGFVSRRRENDWQGEKSSTMSRRGTELGYGRDHGGGGRGNGRGRGTEFGYARDRGGGGRSNGRGVGLKVGGRSIQRGGFVTSDEEIDNNDEGKGGWRLNTKGGRGSDLNYGRNRGGRSNGGGGVKGDGKSLRKGSFLTSEDEVDDDDNHNDDEETGGRRKSFRGLIGGEDIDDDEKEDGDDDMVKKAGSLFAGKRGASAQAKGGRGSDVRYGQDIGGRSNGSGAVQVGGKSLRKGSFLTSEDEIGDDDEEENGRKSFRDLTSLEDSEDDEEGGGGDDDDDDDDDDMLKSAGSLFAVKEGASEDAEEDGGGGDNDDDDMLKSAGSLFAVKKGATAQAVRASPGRNDSYLSESRFDECSVSPSSLKGIKDAGYEKMTVVQEATLPIILKGKDVLAKAKTGTGKTVAFLLPSIEVVVKTPPAGRDQKRLPIIVLVICPTRELASQAAAEANTLLKYHPSIGVQVVIGGTRLGLEQKRMQANPCQILVATPGRLKDHIENTAGFATRLMGLKVLVLDEADHLLDMGFRKDIERIIASVPKQRQTLLFSATVPKEVRQICHIALKRDHEFIDTVGEGTEETNSQVRQMHLVVPLETHFPLLYVLLKEHISDDVDYKVLVFCTTAMVTRLVADLLGELNLNVREIHSRKPQSYRTRVSDEFRKSKGLILVTSDVSARGVDYPDVSLVIQVGLPADREQYVHRLGRTGRKGKEGQGILLLAPWEESFLSSIKDLPIAKASIPSLDPETKKKVERALSHVEMKNKEAAYQAWLGYYNSNKIVGRDKYRLVELANEFSRCMGLDNPPAIPKLILGKMGLRNIPGLRSK